MYKRQEKISTILLRTEHTEQKELRESYTQECIENGWKVKESFVDFLLIYCTNEKASIGAADEA